MCHKASSAEKRRTRTLDQTLDFLLTVTVMTSDEERAQDLGNTEYASTAPLRNRSDGINLDRPQVLCNDTPSDGANPSCLSTNVRLKSLLNHRMVQSHQDQWGWQTQL